MLNTNFGLAFTQRLWIVNSDNLFRNVFMSTSFFEISYLFYRFFYYVST